MAEPINITSRIAARLYAVADPPTVITPRAETSEPVEGPPVTTSAVVVSRDPLLDKLKEHIVQIEAMLAYIILFFGMAVLVKTTTSPATAVTLLRGMSLAFLAGIGAVIRVTNPTSEVRNRLAAGGALAGILGMFSGVVFEALPGGISGQHGTMGGGCLGMFIGFIIGPWYFTTDKPMERGDAFDYLYERRTKSVHVANAGMIESALASSIPWYDKNSDGRRCYVKEDLDAFLKNGPSKQPPS